MSCNSTSTILPTLQATKRGAKFTIGLDWSCHLAGDETLAAAETAVLSAPAEDATILPESNTSIDDTNTLIAIEVADDQAFGDYHLQHVVTTSAAQRYVECFTIRVEDC